MTEIEQIVEGSNVVLPDYSGRKFTEEQIARGVHRSFVSGSGGSWDEDSLAQLTFLRKHGLVPGDRLVDIGCGALRAGRHFIDYLDSGNYFGVDANRDLVTIGYDRELTDAQRAKLPVANLRANDRFNVEFGDARFTMAIAQSVFSHVSLNHVRLCLARLARVMEPGGTFYASYFDQPESKPVDFTFQRHPKGRTYFFEKNVFWYHRSDLEWAASSGPWSTKYVGEYGSSHTQVMMAFTRLTDAEHARRQRRSRQLVDPARVRAETMRFASRARRKVSRVISKG